MRAVIRFVGAVASVSGLLLVADAAVTVLWQEPRVLRKQPVPGDAIGKIELPALDRSYFMVEGAAAENLRKGPAHYPDTPLPGERGTVAVAGHRTTYLAPFRTIDKLSQATR